MNFNNIHKVYFVGIGGIGMSALARFFHQRGAMVSGYDRTQTPLTQKLQEEGIRVHYQDDIKKVPADADLYVYTPAIPYEHAGLTWIRNNKSQLYKRSEILGMLSKKFKTIAVAGTHGKTTISSMITHLLISAGKQVNAFIGGISVNIDSNFVFNEDAEWMVVEADEYDKSFLQLEPDIAVVSAIDDDHLDVYGSGSTLRDTFKAFVGKTTEQGRVYIHEKVKINEPKGIEVITYGFSADSDVYADLPEVNQGMMNFAFHFPEFIVQNLVMEMPGEYNVENALVASAVGKELGLGAKEIREGLKSYKGVKRRFEIRVNSPKHIYIDDYAHHPRELSACIKAARSFFPEKKLIGAFQPHLYSRTRDFVEGFAQSLQMLDYVLLLDIYPAREEPIPGVSSQMIADRMDPGKVRVLSKQEVLEFVKQKKPELFMTLGAGDIDQLVEPLTDILKD
ncbi:MAG: UDP-N-acetylmuramate--L-alanine ligase [Bacteroidales bacterium]|nr:UDP-N-acetylmuramate--L-alanine ligase [Bacteroidales bacterium]MCF8327337.1 UDP-N-acetylmuramate--L-alanine ligase [Bacteroidales bacterium]